MQDVHAKSLSSAACDELAFLFVQKEWREPELGLMTTKWFDYRYIHPVQATYLFAREYEESYRKAFIALFDRRGVRRVFKNTDLFLCDRGTISGIWRARQAADELGMPYDVFTREAIAELLRTWKQSSIPRPTQLYSDRVLIRTLNKWEELQGGMLFYGKHEELKADRYVGTRDQLAHLDWLFQQANLRHHPNYVLRRFFSEGLIPQSVMDDRAPYALERVAA